MEPRQTNILTAEVTRGQIADLAAWWGLYWGKLPDGSDRPNVTAVVRLAIERVWTEEKTRREEAV